jgi:ABC-type nitrate/sulfonate/bicarbonate transport system permease component
MSCPQTDTEGAHSLIAPKVEIEPGGRLIIGLREAAIGGAVAGVVGVILAALIGRMRR